jgi:hypothetical protein
LCILSADFLLFIFTKRSPRVERFITDGIQFVQLPNRIKIVLKFVNQSDIERGVLFVPLILSNFNNVEFKFKFTSSLEKHATDLCNLASVSRNVIKLKFYPSDNSDVIQTTENTEKLKKFFNLFVSNNSQSLKVLDIRACKFLQDNDLISVVNVCSKLEELCISQCDNLTDNFVKHITIERLPNIKVIKISDNDFISDGVLEELKCRMPTYVEVELRTFRWC